MTSDEAFEENRDRINEIDHHPECRGINSGCPINEYPCDCYIKQIFKLGYISSKVISALENVNES